MQAATSSQTQGASFSSVIYTSGRAEALRNLPRLFDVSNDDVSIVGLCSERPAFMKQLAAQICYRDSASTRDALRETQHDPYDNRHQSPLTDLTIRLRAVDTMLLRTQ